jgi:transcriptional regulator of arginine metabolism
VSDNRTKLNFAEKLRTIFRESITSIECAQNIVVVKTMPGLASAACAALDDMKSVTWWELWRATTPPFW